MSEDVVFSHARAILRLTAWQRDRNVVQLQKSKMYEISQPTTAAGELEAFSNDCMTRTAR